MSSSRDVKEKISIQVVGGQSYKLSIIQHEADVKAKKPKQFTYIADWDDTSIDIFPSPLDAFREAMLVFPETGKSVTFKISHSHDEFDYLDTAMLEKSKGW